jgi:hypothetical protein
MLFFFKPWYLRVWAGAEAPAAPLSEKKRKKRKRKIIEERKRTPPETIEIEDMTFLAIMDLL